MEWQPIETAPKDGSIVLLYEDGFVYEGSALENSKRWTEVGYGFVGCGCCADSPKPTHWMPRIALPKD